MALLAPQTVDDASSAVTFAAAAAGGDTAICASNRLLLVRNADTSSKTVTLATPGSVRGLAIADRAVTVAAGETRVIRLDPSLYADSTNTVAITYSAVTSVTVAVLAV